MLFYHGHGMRDYQKNPQPIKRRLHWEFAAILNGQAAPLLEGGARNDLEPALWIFPPHQPHGWIGQQCEVCVVHLAHAPRPISDLAEKDQYIRVSLTSEDCTQIEAANTQILSLRTAFPNSGEIAADIMRGTMSSIALTHLPQSQIVQSADAERTVKQALAWLDEYLDQGMGIAEVCATVGVSPAHLRRLCHQVTGRSPRELLEELRLDRACKLLRKGNRSLEAIAWDCGYHSAVALSQAFLRRFGIRPGKWRKSRSHEQNNQLS